MLFSKGEQSTAKFRHAHFAQLKHMAVFAIVVDSGSFTKAGTRLGIAKSAVSRYVSELEERVGTSLLRRTTRRLHLTDAGERFFVECARLVEAAVDSVESIEPGSKLVGSMCIGATVAHGQCVVVPAVQSFLELHPELDIRLDLSDRFVDLVEHGIDLAVRVGSRGPTPHYISRKIGVTRYRLFATQKLLDAHPPIATPADAERMPWVLGHNGPNPTVWEFRKGETSTVIDVRARCTISSISARVSAAELGMGLIGVPDFMVTDDLAARFVELLADYQIEPEIPIYAVYPSGRFISPRVAAFVAHLEGTRD